MTTAEAILGGALLLGGIAIAARYIADREPGPQPQRTKPDQPQAKPPKRPRRPRRHRGKRITTSTVTENGTVRESPQALLEQARKRAGPEITLEELTAARLIASEHSRGTWQEMTAIVDAELNRAEAKGLTMTKHLTSNGTYGKQGGRHQRGKKRRASTRRDPTTEHLRAARAVLGGEMRGIARGAVRFFDPRAQWAMHRKWTTGKSDRRHCHPLIILERWSYDRKWRKGAPPCTLRTKNGKHLQEWVGPIEGINPLRLMLLRPAKPGDDQERQHEQARELVAAHWPLTGKVSKKSRSKQP